MVTDRDRLAADLHEVGAYRDLDDDENRMEYADRLIALGWTRLDEERCLVCDGRADDPYHGPEPCLLCPHASPHHAFRPAAPTLDEERLARALHRAFHRGHSGDGCEPTYRHGKDAKVIAKAYREDTDAE